MQKLLFDIPDAPWIREVERTGYSRYGWWNTPPIPDDDPEEELLEDSDEDI